MKITIKTDNLTISDVHPAVKPPDGLSWCCRGSPPQPSWRLYLTWTDSAKIDSSTNTTETSKSSASTQHLSLKTAV